MAHMTPPYKNHNRSSQKSANSSLKKSSAIEKSVIATATTKSPSCTPSTNTITFISTTSTTSPETCACTKISVMQLFHEMKQKFSTVPDHIVVDYVTNNCHNRSALFAHLTKQAEANPGSVQAYPQALRNNHNIIGASTKKPSSMTPSPIASHSTQLPTVLNPSTPPTIAFKPVASLAEPPSSTTLSTAESSSSNDKTTLTPTSNATSPAIPTTKSVMTLNNSNNSNSGNPSNSHSDNQVPNSDNHPSPNTTSSEVKKAVLPNRRPTTLNIAAAPASPTLPRLNYGGTSCGPTRVAPPPPDSMNVSLNVTVSPGPLPPTPHRPPVRPVRHTTALSVQPEIAFNRPPPVHHHLNDATHNPRSFTSVHFSLKPLVTNSQSPIDISAGPSLLTYSSASYDARKGCQSRFQITVDGGTGGGTISASRTRPQYGIQPASLNPCAHGDDFNVRRQNTSMPMAGVGSGHFSGSLNEADTVLHRQLLCKQRLSLELESDRRRLYNMQREISTLLSPIPQGGTTRLISEIQRLRQSCKQMVQEVQEAGPAYVLGETNEAFYSNIYTGQPLPRPPRPPRPPPPRPFISPTAATPTSSIHNSASSTGDTITSIAYDDGANNDDCVSGGRPWCCNMCTFQNHPLLNKCEQCEMPLLLTTSGTVAPSPQQYSNIPPASLNASNSALIRQQSAMQPPHPRLQHMPYQQQSAPPVIRNPFQYTNIDGGASGGSVDASASNNVVINTTMSWLTQHTK